MLSTEIILYQATCKHTTIFIKMIMFLKIKMYLSKLVNMKMHQQHHHDNHKI